MVMMKVELSEEVGIVVVGTKEEKKPLARGTQGLAKDDCVTVWFWDVSDVRKVIREEGREIPLGRTKIALYRQYLL